MLLTIFLFVQFKFQLFFWKIHFKLIFFNNFVRTKILFKIDWILKIFFAWNNIEFLELIIISQRIFNDSNRSVLSLMNLNWHINFQIIFRARAIQIRIKTIIRSEQIWFIFIINIKSLLLILKPSKRRFKHH